MTREKGARMVVVQRPPLSDGLAAEREKEITKLRGYMFKVGKCGGDRSKVDPECPIDTCIACLWCLPLPLGGIKCAIDDWSPE